MATAVRIPPTMGKRKHGKPGRPRNPSKDDEVTLTADIPEWLKRMVDRTYMKEGRHMKIVVARLLKVGFGLPADAEGPPEGWEP